MDSQQFTESIYPYRDFIYRNVCYLGVSKEIALDYTQDVLMKLWINRSELKKIQHFKGYIIKIIRNKFLDDVDHEKIFLKRIIPAFRLQSTSMVLNIEERDMLSHVFSVIEKLPGKNRLIFMLRTIDGFSYEELSEIFSMSVDNVRMIISRSRKYIHEEFKKNKL